MQMPVKKGHGQNHDKLVKQSLKRSMMRHLTEAKRQRKETKSSIIFRKNPDLVPFDPLYLGCPVTLCGSSKGKRAN
jgi:hypothetical protein